MEDLRLYFPGCKLTSQEIRENIKKILGLEDFEICYMCFKYVGRFKTNSHCGKCYQTYCEKCTQGLVYQEPGKKGINPGRCPQCLEH
jgi:hypothetical protein